MIRFIYAYVFLGIPTILSLQMLLERTDSLFYRVLFASNFFVAGAAIIISLGAHRKLQIMRSPAFLAAITYYAYTVIQTIVFRASSDTAIESKQIESVLALGLTTLPVIAVGAVCFSWANLKEAIKALNASLTLLSLSVIACAVLHQFGIEFGEVLELSSDSTRYFGPIGDQVGFVSTLGVLMSLTSSRWARASLHLVAVILTGTRGLLPVLGVGILVYAYHLSASSLAGSRIKNVIRLMGALLLVGGMLLSPMGEVVTERITNQAVLEAGVSSRGGAMKLAVEIAADFPWFGVGYGGFTEKALEHGAHLAFSNFDAAFISTPPNPYLEAMVNGGVFGLALYLFTLYTLFRTTRRSIALAPSELSNSLSGIRIWLFAIAIGLQSAGIVLPLSVILLFFILAAVIMLASGWLSTDNDEERALNRTTIPSSGFDGRSGYR